MSSHSRSDNKRSHLCPENLAARVGTFVPYRCNASLSCLRAVMMMDAIRVLIAEDETLVRQSLAQLLDAEPDIEVVAVAADGEQALHLCRQHLPDVVLMDLKMPRMDGIEATKRIKQEMPSVEVCILTIYDDDLNLFEALRAGAKGYVLKDATPQQVAEAIRIVASGGGILSPSLVPKVLAEFQRFAETKAELRKLFSELTPRERDILRLLAQGKSNKEIAQTLFLSEKTVRNYVSNILRKLEVNSRTEAALLAAKHFRETNQSR
ncbi:MAG: response regulator transcription factor [Armatimonadota bacterium]|nr:response regulator transcription factor [Armatimonadota bacterium]MDT7893651.1 response regulator transcription factor [Armatimonadota bacterium]